LFCGLFAVCGPVHSLRGHKSRGERRARQIMSIPNTGYQNRDLKSVNDPRSICHFDEKVKIEGKEE